MIDSTEVDEDIIVLARRRNDLKPIQKWLKIMDVEFKFNYSKNNNKTIYDVVKTFYEIWLLSECDDIIASYWSNFSRVAVLKSIKNPLIVEMALSENPKQPTIDWINEKNIKSSDDLRKHFNIPHPIDNSFRRATMLALSTKI